MSNLPSSKAIWLRRANFLVVLIANQLEAVLPFNVARCADELGGAVVLSRSRRLHHTRAPDESRKVMPATVTQKSGRANVDQSPRFHATSSRRRLKQLKQNDGKIRRRR
jgi:hypothetical protein